MKKILIAHRGNTNGKFESWENEPTYIDMALKKGFDVEIDVWRKDGVWYLGHDKPLYGGFSEKYLENEHFWCHAKNEEAFEYMLKNKRIHSFWHENDKRTLTSNNFVWTFVGEKPIHGSICVLPELSDIDVSNSDIIGICSDYIENYKVYL
jgi:glycerophosphoryl diester phosphodiesterase